MSRDLGVSLGTASLLVSLWALTIAAVGIPLVRATLRVQRRLLLAVSLVAVAGANALTALAPNFAVALGGRILGATAHGLFWALVVAYIASVVERKRLGRALALVLSGPTIAGFATIPAAVFLSGLASWRIVFLCLAVVLVATAAAVWLVLPKHPTEGLVEAGAGRWDRSARGVILITAAGGLVLVGNFAAFTYVVPLITVLGRFGNAAVPVVLLAFGLASGVGVTVSGLVSDRWPRAAVVGAAAILAIGLSVMGLGVFGQPVFIAGVAIWGLGIGALPPILQARVLRVSTTAFRPLAGSIVITVLNLGIAAGATLGGIALGSGPQALVVLAAVAAAAGGLILALSSGRIAAPD
jgi:DHA1 family inner membrane transport protein